MKVCDLCLQVCDPVVDDGVICLCQTCNKLTDEGAMELIRRDFIKD